VEPQSLRTSIGRLNVHSLLWGAPAAPAVLLIHGAGMHARWWDAVAPVLAREYRLIVPDLRGHGETDWAEPPSYMIEDFAADLTALLDHLGVGRVAILGHSMGGRVAAWMAAHMGERPWACGLVETRMSALSQERIDDWRGTRAGQGPRQGFATKAEALAKFRITPTEPNVAQAIRDHLAEHAVVLSRGEWFLRFDRGVLQLDGTRIADFFPLLARISCPTLVVRGQSSTVLGEAGCEAMVRIVPRGEQALLPGGHHCVLGDPAQAAKVLDDFLARATATMAV
jgi:pimeloyl-ACP methyl ester carboxylesterase